MSESDAGAFVAGLERALDLKNGILVDERKLEEKIMSRKEGDEEEDEKGVKNNGAAGRTIRALDLCGLDDWKNVPGLGRTAGESLNMQLYQQGVGKSNITILRRYFQTDEENLWQSWRMGLPYTTKGEGKSIIAKYLAWRVWYIRQRRYLTESDLLVGSFARNVLTLNEPQQNVTRVAGIMSHKQHVGQKQTGSLLITSADWPIFHSDGVSVLAPASNQKQHPRDWEGGLERRYIVLICMHGLICGNEQNLRKGNGINNHHGEYVVELASALARHPGVYRVDLLTRVKNDPVIDADFSVTEETLIHTEGLYGGAYILRIPCGSSEKYLSKEPLWPYVYEFADNAVEVVKQQQAMLSAAGESCDLYAIHGHHADGGEVAALMALTLGADMVMTGHSLGRSRLDSLLNAGSLSHWEVEEAYNISRRIEGEERALDVAMIVFTSTKQEVDDHWGMYDGYATKPANLDGYRKVPVMATIPPGLDCMLRSMGKSGNSGAPTVTSARGSCNRTPKATEEFSKSACNLIWREIKKFLVDPTKPAILGICQSGSAHNIYNLLTAFGSCRRLQKSANLILILGNRSQIDCMDAASAAVLREVLKLVDDFNLYGSVAYPKKHTEEDISRIYSFVADTQGVYVSGDPNDPFERGLIEATAHGIPVVALHNGTPAETVGTLGNGIAVDSRNREEIRDAVLKVVTCPHVWDSFRKNGLLNLESYSWSAHCMCYMDTMDAEKSKRADEIASAAAFRGSWDNQVFEQIVSGGGIRELDMKNNGLINSPEDPESILAGEQTVQIDWECYVADQETTQQPRILSRKSVCAFSFDNQASARTVLKNLKDIINYLPPEGGVVGLGVVSMLGFDPTCSFIEQAGIDLNKLDFIICSSGVDLFVWENGDMVFYDPFDEHIGEYWDKKAVLKILESIPNGSGSDSEKLLKPYKDVHGSSDFGPFHIIMELSKGAEPSADEVSLSDLIKRRIRRAAVRANIVLQVDESPRGATTAPIVHVTPLRACRSQTLRFLMCRIGIPMSEVTIVCCATSLMESVNGERRRVGFAVSDMAPLLEGSQSVVVIPPNKDTQVREPKDGLDAKMIEKLKYEIGRDLYSDRVVMIGEECAVLGGAIGSALSSKSNIV